MRALSASVTILCGLLSTGAAPLDAKAQAAAIQYARSLKASTLDPALPPMRLDDWLTGALAAGRLEWFVSDCDLKSNTRMPPADRLLCIGAKAREHGLIYLRFHLAVGNWAHGVTGPPRVLPQSFVACNPLDLAAVESLQNLERLPELPTVAGKLWNTCPTKQ